MKVLVIDRDAGSRQAYAAIARSGGCIALVCADVGPTFPAAIQGQKIDAIIIGPSLDTGLAPLRRLREDGIQIPVILISAIPVDRKEADVLGVEAILFKPPRTTELREALTALDKSRILNADFGDFLRFLEHCSDWTARTAQISGEEQIRSRNQNFTENRLTP